MLRGIQAGPNEDDRVWALTSGPRTLIAIEIIGVQFANQEYTPVF